jgi:hypothetical protein
MSQSSLRHDDIVRLDLAPVDNSAVDRHVEDMARDNLADWRYWNDPVYGFWARLKRAFDESQRPEGGGYSHTAESGRPGELPPAAPGSSAAIEEPGPEATREEWQSFLATLDVQDHHVATNKSLASGITAMMAEVAGKVGLDLDDEWNMITVPHEGRHPPEYHAYVLGTMQHIAEEVAALPPDSARVEFLRQFQELIADGVREDPQMLRRAAWRDRRHRRR